MRRFVVTLLLVASGSAARAEPCAVAGDPELGGTVAGILATRGIDAGRCGAVHARVERRGETIVVANDTIERTVNDPATAATVIESWVREDLAAPLLAAHAVAIADPLPSIHTNEPLVVTSPSGLHVHASGAFETSFASDRTTWLGPSLGACVELGPVCVAARLRVAAVIAGPGPWDRSDRLETEVLIGGDIPIRIGSGHTQIVPGFGGGIGLMSTHAEGMPETRMYSRTGGLRGDAHVALELPVWHDLAFAVTLGFDITQNTHVETNTTYAFPDEPWLIARLGVGLRYGGS